MAARHFGAPGRVRGYSLIELMIGLLVLVLLWNAGAGMQNFMERQRRSQATLDLRRTLNFARSQAVTLGREITVCALDPNRECQRDWSRSNFAIFQDGNQNRTLDEGEALRLEHWSESKGMLVWRAALRRRHITFNADGSVHQNGSFFYCPRGAVISTRVVVNRPGRNYVDPKNRRSCEDAAI